MLGRQIVFKNGLIDTIKVIPDIQNLSVHGNCCILKNLNPALRLLKEKLLSNLYTGKICF